MQKKKKNESNILLIELSSCKGGGKTSIFASEYVGPVDGGVNFVKIDVRPFVKFVPEVIIGIVFITDPEAIILPLNGAGVHLTL